MKQLTILLFFSLSLHGRANDGAFYAQGNHLIPVFETDISVQKEILTIRKVQGQYIEVIVYYEFFNPGKEKEVLVGFEAASPVGDVNGIPKNGLHPYMHDFTVQMNDRILGYDVAYVSDSLYARSGKIVSRDLKEVEAGIDNQNNVDFYYVYHFKAHFVSGKNIIRHTYTCDLSNSIEYAYDFNYVLTAANRWGNKQIDDFTLILDMGEFETVNVYKSFFADADEWIMNGIGKASAAVRSEYQEADAVQFNVQKGNLIFHKTGFRPKGELGLYARNYYPKTQEFNRNEQLPFSVYQQDRIGDPVSESDRKTLKNLPFARRGYVFSNKEMQQFYEQMDWYMPNLNYKPEVKLLTEQEKEWIARF